MGEKKKGAPSHQALYRKHRSKSLDEIIGQEHITRTLGNAIKQGKISHAYLFTGPKGTGKTSIARILAHEINAIPYTDDATNLDIIEIDAASNRRIDDIRDLREKVNITPISAKYKVYIIDEVHMLTNESFNALLKTLEEPPAHVIFILATTEVHKLPATIISRTQRYSFRLVSTEKVAKHLKNIAKQEGIAIDDEAATLLAEYGEGSFRDSISLLDQIGGGDEPITAALVELLVGIAPRPALEKLLAAAQAGDSKETLTQIENLLEAGLTAGAIAMQLLKLLRSSAKEGAASEQIVSLMQELLSVSGSAYPQMKLESILLGVNPVQTRVVQPVTPTSTLEQAEVEKPATQKLDLPIKSEHDKTKATPIVTPKEVLKEPADTAKPDKPTPKKTNGSFSIENDWQGVLELTKKKNNPLYTVLRLSTPELDGKILELIFAFPFHQKKIDEPKYKNVIAEIIHEQTGAEVIISSVVDKARAKPANSIAAAPKDDAHASLISSVQDIMGGGEIVNL